MSRRSVAPSATYRSSVRSDIPARSAKTKTARYLRGETEMPLSHLFAVADLLGVRPQDLLSRSDEIVSRAERKANMAQDGSGNVQVGGDVQGDITVEN